MKDYLNNPIELIRRKKEFSDGFNKCYNEDIVNELNREIDEDWDSTDLGSTEGEQQLLLTIKELERLAIVLSYIKKYTFIEEYIYRENEKGEFVWADQLEMIDRSTPTYREIYDTLLHMHPSYAEAVISRIDGFTSVDVLDEMISALKQTDSQSFVNILQSDKVKGSGQDLISLIILIRNSDQKWIAKNFWAPFMQILETESLSADEIQWNEDSYTGGVIANALALGKKVDDIDVNDDSEVSKLFDEARENYYSDYKQLLFWFLFVCLEENSILSERQRNQVQELLHAPHLEQWYEKAYSELMRDMETARSEKDNPESPSQNIEAVDNDSAIPNTTAYEHDGESSEVAQSQSTQSSSEGFDLPNKFFRSSDYKDWRVPAIPGFKLSGLTVSDEKVHQFINIVEYLAGEGCIENDAKSKYAFTRAFTRRTINPELAGDFQKAQWYGSYESLLYLVKYFTDNSRDKYPKILDLFVLDPEEDKALRKLLNNNRAISQYAEKASSNFRNAINETLTWTK